MKNSLVSEQMTKSKYNAAVKRLAKRACSWAANTDTSKDIWVEKEEIQKEIARLYKIDDNFSMANKDSVLIMFRLNNQFRAVAFHSFGINIDVERLIKWK